MVRQGQSSAGVLNDWDLSLIVGPDGERRPPGERRERTGTVPFMAMQLLTIAGFTGKQERTYYHDLEGFIWILPWVFLQYNQGTEPNVMYGMDKWQTANFNEVSSSKRDFLESIAAQGRLLEDLRRSEGSHTYESISADDIRRLWVSKLPAGEDPDKPKFPTDTTFIPQAGYQDEWPMALLLLDWVLRRDGERTLGMSARAYREGGGETTPAEAIMRKDIREFWEEVQTIIRYYPRRFEWVVAHIPDEFKN